MHWTEWVAHRVATDPKNREAIEAVLSAALNAFIIGLLLMMMMARSCDVCYEIRLMNVTAQLQACQRGYGQQMGSGFINYTILNTTLTI